MRLLHLPLALALSAGIFTGGAQAQTYDLRNYFDTLNFSQPQVGGSLWTGHLGNQDGALLPPAINHYGYGAYTYTQVGIDVDAGDSSWVWTSPANPLLTPTFNGLFLHPGPTGAQSAAIVFTAQENTWLAGITVKAELIGNALVGNGLDIALRYTRGSVSTLLGGFIVSGSDLFNLSFNLGSTPLLFAAGDRIEIDVGPNGNYTSDHLNIDVIVTGVTTPIPEPETYALMLAGLGLLGFQARRRKRHSA